MWSPEVVTSYLTPVYSQSLFLRIVTFLERVRKASLYFPQEWCYNWGGGGLNTWTTEKLQKKELEKKYFIDLNEN
jgi:hypothetical protein